jgi:hypothetical protein
MGKAERVKGANEELRVAKLYRQVGLKRARRKLSQYQETDGCDIELAEPFIPQCKTGKAISWINAYREAESAAGDNQYPVAHIHLDRVGKFVVLSEADYFEIIKGFLA